MTKSIAFGNGVTCDKGAVQNNSTVVSTSTWSLELPWPAPALSPNARVHWAVLAKTKKSYRARCRVIGLQAGLGVLAGRDGRVAVHLTFVPPDRRARDWDNLVASMKAGLDGLADAMGVDDSRWRLSFEVGSDPVPGGVVAVSVEVTQ